ncbi:hypothetical protein [Pseudomonas sp. Pseusp97]|uniref:hypothetical protein n=1 Tax=Pseudomonas sp. Pseusp97 TaxID=3243065 RepID=UPI0039A6131A
MHRKLPNQTVVVEFTGKNRNGVSKKDPANPKPYWIMEAYAQFPGSLYPQACEFFTTDAAAVKAAGFFEIPLAFPIKDGRASVEMDLSAATPLQTKTAAVA